MSNVGEKAANRFLEGFLCSEAVLMSVAEAKGVNSPLIPKIATAFGSGSSRTNGTCGALNGGIMALSLFKGREDNTQSYVPVYADVQHLKEVFQHTFHTCECSELLGFSLADADAGEKFVGGDCKNTKCRHFIARVADEVMELLKK